MREICEHCGEHEAQIHYTEIGSEGKHAYYLCVGCGLEKGVPIDPTHGVLLGSEETWAGLLHRFSQERDAGDSLACPECGWTFGAFETHSHLGCPHCYQTFMGDMTRLLKDFHGANRHRGKVPHRIGRRIDLRRRILGVKENIQMAIGEERFEDAARLRDEMRDLDEELQRLVNTGGSS